MTHKHALPEPPGVSGADDGRTVELARLWISNDQPAIMVRPAYDDPAAMGQMLAELSWHFAHAYEQKGGHSRAEALQALRAGWLQGHANGDAAQQGNVQ